MRCRDWLFWKIDLYNITLTCTLSHLNCFHTLYSIHHISGLSPFTSSSPLLFLSLVLQARMNENKVEQAIVN
jgi:hypothetical protein